MASAVITGSSKGIGRGLAEQFVRRGHHVVICSRNQDDVDQTAAALGAAGPGKAIGQACDVTLKSDVQRLWDRARQDFGRVDYWINNAGHATARYEVHELPEDIVHRLVDGNLKGTVFGSQVAIAGFRAQGAGALYNMLGGSFEGKRLTPRMGVYSSTKAAVWMLTKYLVHENQGRNIVIGAISPGMLISDNWFDEQARLTPEEWQKIRPLLNVLCDHVETSTPWLVEQVLANQTSGRRIAWLTTGKIARRFFNAYVLRRNRDVGEDARRGRIYLPVDELQRFGVTAQEVLNRGYSERFTVLMKFQADRAQAVYDEALALLPQADRRAQKPGLMMASIYRALLREIEADKFQVLHQRISLTPLRKFWLAWRVQALGRV